MQSFQVSFKCHFGVDDGVEKQARLLPSDGPHFDLECDQFMVRFFLIYIGPRKNKAGDRPRPTHENGPDPIF